MVETSAQSPNAADTRAVLGIDVLRLVAALMVVVFHLGFKALADDTGLIATHTTLAPWMPGSWPLTWWGWVGVQVFFVISGLVIAFSALSPRATPGRFLRSRVLRLVPCVLIASCFAFVVEVGFFGTDPAQAALLWAKTVTFFPLAPWIMNQFWTLGVEIGFYAIVLILIASRAQSALPRLGYILIGISLAYWTLRIGTGGTDPLGRITQLILFQHGCYFGIGILLADMSRGGPQRHWLAIVPALLVAAAQIRMSAGWEGGKQGVDGAWLVAVAVFYLTVAFAVAALRWNGWAHNVIGPGLAGKFRTAGMMTYPLYLVHNHAGKPIIVVGVNAGLPVELAIVLAVAGSLLVAWVIARLAEPVVYRGLSTLYDFVAAKVVAKSPAGN